VRAPSNKERLDKIVCALVESLQDNPDGWDSSEADVRSTIEYCRALDREIKYRGELKERMAIRGKRQENLEDFAELLKQVKGLQKALKKVSAVALFLLFSGENAEAINNPDKLPSVEARQKVLGRAQGVTKLLDYLHARCDFLLAKRPGEHGGADYRQRRVAHEGWKLMRRHGKEPAGGTFDSLFGQITSLLWTAVTEEKNKDLQWACKETLRLAANEGGLSD
jgi:hypothetical protein